MRAIGFVIGLTISAVLLFVALLVVGAFFPASIMIITAPFFLAVYLAVMALCYLLAWLASTSNAGLNTASAIAFLLVVVPVLPVLFHPSSLFRLLFIALFLLVGYLGISLAKVILTVIGYAVGSLSQVSLPPLEQLARGFLVGVNAPHVFVLGLYSYALLIIAVFNPLMTGLIGVVVGLTLIYILFLWFLLMPPVGLMASTDPDVKHMLGRSVFLTPTSWFVCGLGSFFFLGSLGLHWIGAITGSITLRVVSVSIFPPYRSIVMRGGLAGNSSGSGTEYDLGTFILSPSGVSPDVEHESGHQLSLAIFGGVFHFVGWLEEIPTFLGAHVNVYAENIADSNKTPPPATSVRVWN